MPSTVVRADNLPRQLTNRNNTTPSSRWMWNPFDWKLLCRTPTMAMVCLSCWSYQPVDLFVLWEWYIGIDPHLVFCRLLTATISPHNTPAAHIFYLSPNGLNSTQSDPSSRYTGITSCMSALEFLSSFRLWSPFVDCLAKWSHQNSKLSKFIHWPPPPALRLHLSRTRQWVSVSIQ